MAFGERVRGRHRGLQPAAGAGVHAAAHPLRLAPAGSGGRGRRRPGVRRCPGWWPWSRSPRCSCAATRRCWCAPRAAGAAAAVAAVAVHAGLAADPRQPRPCAGSARRRWAGYATAGAPGGGSRGPWVVLVLSPRARRSWRCAGRGCASHAWALLAAAPAAGGLGALAWVAFKVGALSYGGGFVIIPLMQADAVDRYGWLSGDSSATPSRSGRSPPGPVVHTVVGGRLRRRGRGRRAARRGVAFAPSFAFVLLGARHFERLRADRRVRAFLDGAGPAAIGAILGSAVPLAAALSEPWQGAVLAGGGAAAPRRAARRAGHSAARGAGGGGGRARRAARCRGLDRTASAQAGRSRTAAPAQPASTQNTPRARLKQTNPTSAPSSVTTGSRSPWSASSSSSTRATGSPGCDAGHRGVGQRAERRVGGASLADIVAPDRADQTVAVGDQDHPLLRVLERARASATVASGASVRGSRSITSSAVGPASATGTFRVGMPPDSTRRRR